jgi:peptidoglycan/LPS O-acetylase OafA/YrhL
MYALDEGAWWVETLNVLPMMQMVSLADRRIAGRFGQLLEIPLILFAGRISYGIYLYHSFVVDQLFKHSDVIPFVSDRGLGLFVIGTSITFGIACASWFLVESPMNALKRYFPYETRPSRLARQGRTVPAPARQ